MQVTAKLVKELREKTGAGILDSKKALEATNCDIDKAIEFLKTNGQIKATKKSNRIAAEGLVQILSDENSAVIVEINSETDFVSKNIQFQELVKTICTKLLKSEFSTSAEASNILIDGKKISDLCLEATSVIGEKIKFRRAVKFLKEKDEVIGMYTHANNQIASLVKIKGGNLEMAKNLAMHVTAMNPEFMDAASMPKAKIELFKKEIMEELSSSNKPEKIKEIIAEGKLKKILSTLTLVDQEFVMEKMPVSKYLSSKSAELISMIRFEVGEGIEKPKVNFAEEVNTQMSSK